MAWLREIGFEFVSSLPKTRPFQPVDEREPLFVPQQPANALERFIAELSMIREGSREGGFFVVIGRAPA